MAISAAAAVSTVVGIGMQAKAASDQRKAQKEQGKVSSASQRIEDRNTRRQSAREARIKQAQIKQLSENTGVSSSSGAAGASSVISTQIAANSARISGQQLAADRLTELNQDIADAQYLGQIGQGAQQVGTAAFSKAGGFDALFKGS